MLKLNILISIIGVALLIVQGKADTPANCSYEDVRGVWIFHEGSRLNDKTINCSQNVSIKSAFTVHLNFPNVATDVDGNIGYWTIIYNQGFEVVINNRKYFAYSLFENNGTSVISYCSHTSWGWAHGTGVNPGDWSCFIGAKIEHSDEDKQLRGNNIEVIKETTHNDHKQKEKLFELKTYERNIGFVNKINGIQSSWHAVHYDFMNRLTISDLVKMAGGKKSKIINKPKPAPVNKATKKLVSELPDSFDWRNISGISHISPVRNQGSCGSCYAFASMAMNEARLRIKTSNANQSIFSTQDIVECSEYSQGCDGGFPYLIGGKYAEDFGLVNEECNPYTGKGGKCRTEKSCKRQYSTDYFYVGGFYGACNADLMRIELHRNGPLAVSFNVYDDFFNYKGGIYHHTFLKDTKNFKFNPFELTNHAVLLVGYGQDNATGEKYWIIKNSWGTGWGENGFFRIRRETDECSIESIAVGSNIVF